ncbi:hypothetical protein SAMN02745866_03613 [Alteromonadaceae bacterium Bs31]|nr:hypothetical protein SAMN02745866_03613 [Alteromonadaceae bacterium Bs31]
MNNPVGWFEIYVQDMARAKTFYESVFNVTLEDMPNPDNSEAALPSFTMCTFPMSMEHPGASGALVQMEGAPSGGNSTLIYFNCDDCASEQARAVEAGGKLFREKFSIGEHGFISLVFDSEENMIGLHSMK